jgi:hypothetical protein
VLGELQAVCVTSKTFGSGGVAVVESVAGGQARSFWLDLSYRKGDPPPPGSYCAFFPAT